MRCQKYKLCVLPVCDCYFHTLSSGFVEMDFLNNLSCKSMIRSLFQKLNWKSCRFYISLFTKLRSVAEKSKQVSHLDWTVQLDWFVRCLIFNWFLLFSMAKVSTQLILISQDQKTLHFGGDLILQIQFLQFFARCLCIKCIILYLFLT